MTANKRRKNKARAIMESTGTNYTRAARAAGITPAKKDVDLSWSPGTVPNNAGTEKFKLDFLTGYFSHLFIAGISPDQPELLLEDMIDQISSNNRPEDVHFSIIEPAMALMGYATSAHTKNYVDSWTPGGFLKNVAGLLSDLITEMDRRYALFINHNDMPKNLAKARSIALKESRLNGTPVSDHELYLPYKIIVIHEISSLIINDDARNEEAERRQVFFAFRELASKARAAGIHIACSSQYPNIEAGFPKNFRDMMQIIGLKTKTEEVSQRIIGDNSCFVLSAGKGVVKQELGSATLRTIFDRNPQYLPYSYFSKREQ